MTALHGTEYNLSSIHPNSLWDWEDMSTDMYNGLPEVQFKAPFRFSESASYDNNLGWLLMFHDTAAATNGADADSYGVIRRVFILKTNSSNLQVTPVYGMACPS